MKRRAGCVGRNPPASHGLSAGGGGEGGPAAWPASWPASSGARPEDYVLLLSLALLLLVVVVCYYYCYDVCIVCIACMVY